MSDADSRFEWLCELCGQRFELDRMPGLLDGHTREVGGWSVPCTGLEFRKVTKETPSART